MITFASLPRAVSKYTKECHGISRPPPSPPDPTTDSEPDHDSKGEEKVNPKRHQDLISLALSDYNIWLDPTSAASSMRVCTTKLPPTMLHTACLHRRTYELLPSPTPVSRFTPTRHQPATIGNRGGQSPPSAREPYPRVAHPSPRLPTILVCMVRRRKPRARKT